MHPGSTFPKFQSALYIYTLPYPITRWPPTTFLAFLLSMQQGVEKHQATPNFKQYFPLASTSHSVFCWIVRSHSFCIIGAMFLQISITPFFFVDIQENNKTTSLSRANTESWPCFHSSKIAYPFSLGRVFMVYFTQNFRCSLYELNLVSLQRLGAENEEVIYRSVVFGKDYHLEGLNLIRVSRLKSIPTAQVHKSRQV